MKTHAIVRNVHLSSRKANLVCALIRYKNVSQALTILQQTNKKAAKFLLKLLSSAIANATNNHSMKANQLYVYNAIANQGKTDKRMMPRAKGSSNVIKKRHCHLEIILSDDPNQKQVDLKKVKLAKKTKSPSTNKKTKENSDVKQG